MTEVFIVSPVFKYFYELIPIVGISQKLLSGDLDKPILEFIELDFFSIHTVYSRKFILSANCYLHQSVSCSTQPIADPCVRQG
jgi:hypothetical protein